MYDQMYDLYTIYLVHDLLELLLHRIGLYRYDLSNQWFSEIMIYLM